MQLQYDTPIIGQARDVWKDMVIPEVLPPTWDYMSNENRYQYGSAQRDSMFGELIKALIHAGRDKELGPEAMIDYCWEFSTIYGKKIGGQLAQRGL